MDWMNIKKYKTMIDILNIVNGSLISYTIIITLLFTIGESEYTLPSVLLLILPILSYYLEKRSKHIFTFIICHIITGFIFYSLPKHQIVKIIFIVYAIIVMIYHLYRRIKLKSLMQKNISYGYILVLIAMQLYANWKADSQLSRMIQIITLLFSIIYFITVYLFNFTVFFTNHVENASINFKRVKRINHSLITGFIIIITLIMTGAFSVPIDKLLYTLKSTIIFLLRKIFSRIEPAESEIIEPVEVITPNMDQILPIEQTEPNPIWLLVEKILFKLCIVVIILAFASLIIYGLYQLYKLFHSNQTDETEKKEFISPFYKENSVKRIKKTNKITFPHFFHNNNDKIRDSVKNFV